MNDPMTTILPAAQTDGISETADLRRVGARLSDAWGDTRWHIGSLLERAGHRIAYGESLRDGEDETYRAGYESAAMQRQYTARHLTKMISLAFEAGQQAPQSTLPLGAAYEMGYDMGRRDAVRREGTG